MTDDDLIAFTAVDGLRLAARDVAGPSTGAGVVLCLHGLTRNSRDFEGLAAALRADHRVLALDQRGRGRSGYDPNPLNYNLGVQVGDTWAWLDHLEIERVVVVGTSMGALMAIAMANMQPDRIAGLVLNDAGPVVDPRGLARIAGYVGKGGPAPGWDEAAAALQAVHGPALPTYGADDWRRMARATYVEAEGGLRLDYDPNLAQAFAADTGTTPDMWPAFAVLETIPGLVLRGALSDILAAETAAEMARRFPKTEAVTVPDRGHAPDLSEPTAVRAIQGFLNRPDVRAGWTDR
ncbi:MAG TPA: alpha/beta hydrolase [Phenylobacterium sp.]|nr:alpha/beta hydrolase [Phenylobacterium sp.]